MRKAHIWIDDYFQLRPLYHIYPWFFYILQTKALDQPKTAKPHIPVIWIVPGGHRTVVRSYASTHICVRVFVGATRLISVNF